MERWRKMKLKKLIQDFEIADVKGSKEIEISGICSDSRRLSPGNLFIAKKGNDSDGNRFIGQAIDNGASAVLTEFYNPFLGKITQLIDPRIYELEGKLADRFYRYPSRELYVFSVTGTNGKTTTTYLVKHLLDAMNLSCGLIGTVETIVGDRRSFSTLTTHDVVMNHKLLREMVDGGCRAVALEASSHGLVQGRLDQMDLDAALFTNLTPDHLDYHRTIEEYAEAKRHLFKFLNNSSKSNPLAIANGDDDASISLLQGCQANRLFFGLGSKCDVRAENISFSPLGTTFQVRYKEQSYPFFTPLIGRFNVYNVLGAICVGLHRNFSLEQMASVFASFQTVPGRLERVAHSRKFHVFIDYAHTGDALENVLQTLREIAHRKIITVFGAGGNRDPGRRLGLARAAEKGSDINIITSDNPRTEDPEEICRQILLGFSDTHAVRVELDRQRAIELAISMAEPEDIVLIAGKGHERVQIFNHHTVPFDDHAVALEALGR
jgi:UDP-N-acetylmuramoyl-L-alanyl-D-glutamate--2,6-diaminopimelate ligase